MVPIRIIDFSISPFSSTHLFNSVQALSQVWLCDPMRCSTPGFSVHHQLQEVTQTHAHRVDDSSNHLILCHPLLLQPSIFPSIKVCSNEPVLCIKWAKYWSFSFSISSSSEYSGLISFRMDWLDLLAVQHHSSKASAFWCLVFYSPTLTSIHDYWKSHSFDWTDLCWQSDVSAF